MRWNNPAAAFLLAFLLFTCLLGCRAGQTQGNSDLQAWIQVIDSGIQGISIDRGPSVKWIDSPEQLQRVVAEFGKQRISQFPVFPADIDFHLYRMLLIEMGRRSTGGYSVTLGSHAAQVSDDTVVIHVVWNVPDTGAVLAQVVTSPYLLLKLAKGDYRRVVVVDQENEILFEIDVLEF